MSVLCFLLYCIVRLACVCITMVAAMIGAKLFALVAQFDCHSRLAGCALSEADGKLLALVVEEAACAWVPWGCLWMTSLCLLFGKLTDCHHLLYVS